MIWWSSIRKLTWTDCLNSGCWVLGIGCWVLDARSGFFTQSPTPNTQHPFVADLEHIRLSLQLAAQGAALVSPNPLVGSVVVKDGEIVGRGYHRYADLKHAEVWALEEAGPRARGATAYINLEPCAHQGAGKRTPPCVQALLDAGVKRVVASMVDPNPKVNGRGFELLRAAGIEVAVGLMEREAQRLNEKYTKFVATGRPFVHLKVACSLDGRIATRARAAKWITGEEARAASQALRHDYDAIMVGVGTVLADDPLLSDRTQQLRRRPLARLVLDAGLRTPLTSQLVQTAQELPLIIFAAEQEGEPEADVSRAASGGVCAPPGFDEFAAKRRALEQFGAEVVPVKSNAGRLDLAPVLAELGRREITSLIVEGGAEVAGSIIDGRLADKLTFFIAPKIIGGRDAVPAIGGWGCEGLSDALELRDVELVKRGADWEVTGYPRV
jgi:diaminohydroxyphosphoribosylaminopyrimidine deaminase/5-amino-6-(5-phosphoribosylamino)uracil reductase